MSTDQKTTYQLVTAVQRGELKENMQYLKCGQLSHARWLTTGQRVFFLWTRDHGLSNEDRKTLRTLVKFFITFYFKLYYDIKVKHLMTDAPRHVLTGVKLLRQQPMVVRKVITPHIQSGAWYAHPENLLLSLLSSSDRAEREFGVEKVLTARGSNVYGDNSPRPRHTPPLNFSAEILVDLIQWDKTEVMEPSLTTHLSRAEIEAMRDIPLSVPPFSCHTQSTERCVKLTTEAAASVAGQEARHKFIISRICHRNTVPKFKSKSDILSTFNIL